MGIHTDVNEFEADKERYIMTRKEVEFIFESMLDIIGAVQRDDRLSLSRVEGKIEELLMIIQHTRREK